MVKNLPANAGDLRDVGSIPGFRRPPGGGHGSPLQCPCLESPMDIGAWLLCLRNSLGVAVSETEKVVGEAGSGERSRAVA